MTVTHDVYIKVVNGGTDDVHRAAMIGSLVDYANKMHNGSGYAQEVHTKDGWYGVEFRLRERVEEMRKAYAVSIKNAEGILWALEVDGVVGPFINLLVVAPEDDFSFCDLIVEELEELLLPILNDALPEGACASELSLVKDVIIP